MRLSIPVTETIEVNITIGKIARYLDRTGWELLYVRDAESYRVAVWHHEGHRPLIIRSDDLDPAFPVDMMRNLARYLTWISAAEGRPLHLVARDVAKEEE